MKQYILYSLFILAGLVTACDNERSGLVKTGTVVLGVDKNETLQTKAGVPVADEKLQVYFINIDGDTTKFYNDYKQEVEGKKILLPVGSYTVKVTSASTKEPAWETPSYYGEEEIEVTAGEIVKAAIECKISNTKVYVKYTESVKKYFSNYQAMVSNTGGKLTYLKDETRAGFFAPEKLTVDLKLTNKENGLTFDLRKVFPDIKPCYQYKLLFDVATPGEPGDSSGENVDIEINTDSSEVKITIKLPKYAENGDNKPMPKFAISTILADDNKLDGYEAVFTRTQDEAGNYQNVVKEQTATIESPLGLKYLYVKLSDTFAGMPPMFDLLKKEIDPISITADKDKKKVEIHLEKLINSKMLPDEKRVQTYTITMTAIDLQHQETEQVFTYTAKPDLPLSTLELTTADIWTTFAVLRGAGADATDTYFEYKTKEETLWNKVVATKDDKGNLNSLIINLKADTEYSYKVIGKLNGESKEGEIYTFSTLKEGIVPNLNFDNWSKAGDSQMPNKEGESYWDSGNKGANSQSGLTGVKNPTSEEKTIVIAQSAVKLESTYISAFGFGAFASASIFSGDFVTVDGTNGILKFGRKIEGRPTKLSGYFQYYPKAITDYSSDCPDPTIKKGVMDQGHIYVALCTKEYDIRTNPKNRSLFNKDDSSVIGYGELICIGETTGQELNKYKKIEIEIQYKKTNVLPSHIVIVAAASKYGDYFTGGQGSVLYLDEFMLHYDYDSSSVKNTELGGLTPANK